MKVGRTLGDVCPGPVRERPRGRDESSLRTTTLTNSKGVEGEERQKTVRVRMGDRFRVKVLIIADKRYFVFVKCR